MIGTAMRRASRIEPEPEEDVSFVAETHVLVLNTSMANNHTLQVVTLPLGSSHLRTQAFLVEIKPSNLDTELFLAFRTKSASKVFQYHMPIFTIL